MTFNSSVPKEKRARLLFEHELEEMREQFESLGLDAKKTNNAIVETLKRKLKDSTSSPEYEECMKEWLESHSRN